MRLQRIDHVGIIVEDLPAAKAFFLDFGLQVEGEVEMKGAWLDEVVGLDHVQTAVVYMQMPDGQTALELAKFITPPDREGIQQPLANTLGIRHIAFEVDDIEAVVARMREKGHQTFSPIQSYEQTYKLCYVRGPEGIILELAERIQ